MSSQVAVNNKAIALMSGGLDSSLAVRTAHA